MKIPPLLFILAFLSACGADVNHPPTESYQKQLLDSRNNQCPNGAVLNIEGVDADLNGELELGEYDVLSQKCLLASQTHQLNDTGITDGASLPTGNHLRCYGDEINAQDCAHGADAIDSNHSDGYAGFKFLKLDQLGNILPADAASWSCTKDETTGLVWEIKTSANQIIGDGGLHDADDLFTWYNSLPSGNGGNAGSLNKDINQCHNYSNEMPLYYCNTQGFIARVNLEGLCGYRDWRLPTLKELFNLTHLGVNKDGQEFKAVVDSKYFPNTQQWGYWSSDSKIEDNEFVDPRAWILNFQFGTSMAVAKSDARYLRLVRGPE